MPTQHYKINLPDCVAFDLDSYLADTHRHEFSESNIRYWVEPMSYSRTSGWYYIYADDIVKFFDMLLDTNFANEHNFEDGMFRGVMYELLERHYLDDEQYKYYMEEFPHTTSIKEMVDTLKQRGSYQDYIDYINNYDSSNHGMRKPPRTIDW